MLTRLAQHRCKAGISERGAVAWPVIPAQKNLSGLSIGYSTQRADRGELDLLRLLRIQSFGQRFNAAGFLQVSKEGGRAYA